MKHIRAMMLAVVVLALCASGAYAGNYTLEYGDGGKFDAQKMAKKLVKSKAKNFKSHKVSKVLIVEAYGEFLTKEETSGASGQFAWQGGSTFTRELEMSEDYYETVVNYVYGAVETMLEHNGIDVIDKNLLLENEDYQALGLKTEKTTRGFQKATLTKKAKVSETLKRSTTGMGMITGSGVFKDIKNVMKLNTMLPKITHDNGADAMVKINFFVGQGKNFKPTLTALNIILSSNMGEAKAGKDKVDYYFKSGDVVVLELKDGLETKTEVLIDKKQGTIDMQKYHESLNAMIDAALAMYDVELKNALGK